MREARKNPTARWMSSDVELKPKTKRPSARMAVFRLWRAGEVGCVGAREAGLFGFETAAARWVSKEIWTLLMVKAPCADVVASS
jgi:hypothetical protein